MIQPILYPDWLHHPRQLEMGFKKNAFYPILMVTWNICIIINKYTTFCNFGFSPRASATLLLGNCRFFGLNRSVRKTSALFMISLQSMRIAVFKQFASRCSIHIKVCSKIICVRNIYCGILSLWCRVEILFSIWWSKFYFSLFVSLYQITSFCMVIFVYINFLSPGNVSR